MALVTSVEDIPLASNFPMPNSMFSASNYKFQAKIFEDDASTPSGTVIAHRGAGATNFHGDSDPIITELVGLGYRVVSFAYWDVEGSSSDPFRYGYGNVNSPHYSAFWIRNAWEVESTVDWFETEYPSEPYVLYGHSRGATACIAWGAGFCGIDAPATSTRTDLKGIVANGPSGGGLGSNRWNDPNRLMNSLSNALALNTVKMILSHGGLDDFIPPDMMKRIQQVIPLEAETYVLTPGPSFVHAWTNTSEGAPILAMWVDQLMKGDPITLADGVTPAVPGPVVLT